MFSLINMKKLFYWMNKFPLLNRRVCWGEWGSFITFNQRKRTFVFSFILYWKNVVLYSIESICSFCFIFLSVWFSLFWYLKKLFEIFDPRNLSIKLNWAILFSWKCSIEIKGRWQYFHFWPSANISIFDEAYWIFIWIKNKKSLPLIFW